MIRKSSVRMVVLPCKRDFSICCKTKQQKSIGLLPPQNDINSSAHIKQPTQQKKRTARRQNRKQHSCKAAKIIKTNKALDQTHPIIQQNKTKQRKTGEMRNRKQVEFRWKSNRKTCVSRETRRLTEQIFYRIWQAKPMCRQAVLMAM